MPLKIVRQDITKMQVDAIVNTTNEEMIGYSGVDLAVHTAAGAACGVVGVAGVPVRGGEGHLPAGKGQVVPVHQGPGGHFLADGAAKQTVLKFKAVLIAL